MSFGRKLKQILKDKKVYAKDLAEYVGVSRGLVTHWANDFRNPNPKQLKMIAEYLNIDPAILINDGDRIKISKIPLIGLASCGIPNGYYNDEIEYIPVPEELARDGVYAVRAEGDSMMPKIADGAVVICDKERGIDVGNIVHYTTADGESGIKKYDYDEENDLVVLMPLNTECDGCKPIFVPPAALKMARAVKVLADL